MARDSNLDYAAVAGSFNPPVAGTTISSTDFQTLLDDIEAAINDSAARPKFRISQADEAKSDVDTAQAVFASAADVLTLAAGTTYYFEWLYWITRAAGTTSHTTGLLFPASSAFTNIMYHVTVANPTGNVLGAASRIIGDASTETVITAANTSATENLMITGSGILVTNLASTVTPQFKYSAAPGGAPTVKRGSYISFVPLGDIDVVSYGSWA